MRGRAEFLTPQREWARRLPKLELSSSRVPSSLDSGFGSLGSSRTLRYGLQMDGPDSSSDSAFASGSSTARSSRQQFSADDEGDGLDRSILNSPSFGRKRAIKIGNGLLLGTGRTSDDDEELSDNPRPKKKSKASSLSTVSTSMTVKKTTPTSARAVRFSDRFVPLRTPATPTFDRFRMTKNSGELTPAERVLRSSAASSDPFTLANRRVIPLPNNSLHPVDATDAHFVVGNTTTADAERARIVVEIRQPSLGTVWSVGGLVNGGMAIDNGRGGLMRTGTSAPLFVTSFNSPRPDEHEDLDKHSGRIAAALEIDRTSRVLDFTPADRKNPDEPVKKALQAGKTEWTGTRWFRHRSKGDGPTAPPRTASLPMAPFKVLDAPELRDDFYCSLLAYNATSHRLVVGLGNTVHSWAEPGSVDILNTTEDPTAWITSLAFSSEAGRRAILAFGRHNGRVGLVSMFDAKVPRFHIILDAGVASLAWKPRPTTRPSDNPAMPGAMVETEDLLVGDESGVLYYYSVEWPFGWDVAHHSFAGSVKLLARVHVHSQQVCGLSWSPDGSMFATGGNDNACYLFDTDRVLRQSNDWTRASTHSHRNRRLRSRVREPHDPVLFLPTSHGLPIEEEKERDNHVDNDDVAVEEVQAPAAEDASDAYAWMRGVDPNHAMHTIDLSLLEYIRLPPRTLGLGCIKRRWVHGAAVKAIAFCPWQPGLVATGGGSSDKCIHFFHTTSGASLATISVAAQVTSLTWSTTRREIAATFGYAQPEHPIRIAVYAWPSCELVVSVPWEGEHRALYAISYPPNPATLPHAGPGSSGTGISEPRTSKEGCLVVAASDSSIKFHEVWASDSKTTRVGCNGILGSDILELMENIEPEGDVLR